MAPVDKSKVPWWVSNLIVPLVNLILALLVSGLFIFIAGENPYEAVRLIIYGSFGYICLLYTSPSPRDGLLSRMPSSA